MAKKQPKVEKKPKKKGKDKPKTSKAKDTKSSKKVTFAADAHRIWLAGLGAAVRAQAGDTELFEELVETGRTHLSTRSTKVKEKFAGIKDDLVDWFVEARDDLSERIDQQVEETLHKVGVPTGSAIDELTEKINQLTERLAGLETVEPKAAEPVGPVAQVKVAPHPDGWQLTVDGDEVGVHRTKGPAVAAARVRARENAPSVLVVLRADGSEQERNSYEAVPS